MRFIHGAVAFLLCLTSFYLPTAEAVTLSEVVRRVNPSVVVIHTVEKNFSPKTGEDDYHQGLGSGVIISPDGLVMTAAHLVQMSEAVVVELIDGRRLPATIVANAPVADVSLLKIEDPPEDLVAAAMGDSDKVEMGQQVFVLGAPYGIDHTLTVGYVSARRTPKMISSRMHPMEVIQTDAAINQGNSGGPLFNQKGEVIGIVSHIMSQSGGSEGLGFTVAIKTAKSLLLGKSSFWFGWQVLFIDGDLAAALNLPQEAGLLVQRVASNSKAHEMGVKGGNLPFSIGPEKLILGGDVVLEVDGNKITSDVDDLVSLGQYMDDLAAGELFMIKVLRKGKTIELSGVK